MHAVKVFPRAHHHLDERTRVGAFEGRFKAMHGLDLAVSQPLRDELRHESEAAAKRSAVLQGGVERDRLVEGEEGSGAGMRVP